MAHDAIEQRIALVRAFAEQVKTKREDLAALIHAETGKPLWESRTEIDAMAAKVEISIEAYHDRTPSWHNDNLRLNHRAHGVFAVFGSYNFPGHLPMGILSLRSLLETPSSSNQ